jgi:hypothetical protein
MATLLSVLMVTIPIVGVFQEPVHAIEACCGPCIATETRDEPAMHPLASSVEEQAKEMFWRG